MNNGDRIIAQQKAITALGQVQGAAKEASAAAKATARSFARLGKALMKSLPHQYEEN